MHSNHHHQRTIGFGGPLDFEKYNKWSKEDTFSHAIRSPKLQCLISCHQSSYHQWFIIQSSPVSHEMPTQRTNILASSVRHSSVAAGWPHSISRGTWFITEIDTFSIHKWDVLYICRRITMWWGKGSLMVQIWRILLKVVLQIHTCRTILNTKQEII